MRTVSFIMMICLCFCASGCARAMSAPVQSCAVLIDPGHGGFDGGAVASDGTTEKHLNLAVSLCLHDLMRVCGVDVGMTRRTDVGLNDDTASSIREKKSSDMRRRLRMYDAASLVISIHQNHFSQPQYSGVQVFYSPNHPDSGVLAETIRRSIVARVQPQNTRECKKATDGIYLLYHTATPAVLVECGFLSNPEERHQLKNAAYQQQLAFALMAGYWDYCAR